MVDEDQDVTLMARWGEQLHVHHLTRDDGQDDTQLSAEQVAGYVAKYATKSTEALGVTLDHRLGEVELEDLDLPAHVVELVRACWELGTRPSLRSLRLRKWAHMLGLAATSRPRAAATPPPWGRCDRPGSPTRSAGVEGMRSRLMPGVGSRTTRR
jgi:hypothetical protein